MLSPKSRRSPGAGEERQGPLVRFAKLPQT